MQPEIKTVNQSEAHFLMANRAACAIYLICFRIISLHLHIFISQDSHAQQH